MAEQTIREEPKAAGGPVPSSAMYVGLCTTRAQSANLRWQKAVVFMTLNGVVGSLCFNFLEYDKAGKLFTVTVIAVVMFAANLLFRGLVNRANQWIDYFTIAIERIEQRFGTESDVLVFADPNYLAKQAAESLVRGFRFRSGIRALSDGMLLLWGGIFLGCVVRGAYLAGQGSW